MRRKKNAESTTLISDDPADRKGALKPVGGSLSDNWNNLLANQAVHALWLGNSDQETSKRQYGATVVALIGSFQQHVHAGLLELCAKRVKHELSIGIII
jgi:hypothetical protein